MWFELSKSRSSRPEVLCKKSVLRNFAKFTGKHLCQSLLPECLRTPISFFFFSIFFPEQIYTKVQSATITGINKYKKTHYKQLKKKYKEIKLKKRKSLPTHPVCFSQGIIKLLVKCYL